MNKASVEKLLNDDYVFLRIGHRKDSEGKKIIAVEYSQKYGEWQIYCDFPTKKRCVEVIDNLVSNSNFKYLT